MYNLFKKKNVCKTFVYSKISNGSPEQVHTLTNKKIDIFFYMNMWEIETEVETSTTLFF